MPKRPCQNCVNYKINVDITPFSFLTPIMWGVSHLPRFGFFENPEMDFYSSNILLKAIYYILSFTL